MRRPFRWRDLGDSLLAERTLNTLLGLGAFLILASALVISVLNPTRLALVPHLGVLAGTMALFYVAGYVCYARVGLTRAGEALLAIAAAFVPLDIWILGGADGLGWSRAEIWAVASAVALPVYALSYLLLPGRPFAWFVALAAESLLLASLNIVGAPGDWTLCASIALAFIFIMCSQRLQGQRWTNLRAALFSVAHVVTPTVMLLLLAAKFGISPGSWGVGVVSDYAVGTVWWLGVGVYALSARVRKDPFEAMVAWLVPVAYLLTLTKAPWDPSWYGVWFVGLAGVYTRYAGRFGRAGATKNHARYVAVVLSVGGLIWAASADVSWALFAAAVADGALAASSAATMRNPRVAFISAAMFILACAIGLLLVQWPGWTIVQPWPWLVLAIGLAFAAEVHIRTSNEPHRPLQALLLGRGNWHALFAPALFDASCAASLIAVIVAVWRASTGDTLVASTALTIAAVVLVTLSRTRRSSELLYPASALVAGALALATWAVFPDARTLSTGLALAVLGAAYGYMGLRLGAAAGASYRRPLWLTGLLLSILGPALTLLASDMQRQAVAVTACAVAYAAALAVIRRPVWSYPVALWSVVSYELIVRVLITNPRVPDLLGALVVPTCVALLLGVAAARRSSALVATGAFALARLAHAPWAVPPLAVAGFGFVLSMLTVQLDPTVGTAVTATYAIALAVVALHHGDLPGERWASLALLALAVIAPYDQARARSEWLPPVVLGFGVLLALLSVAAERSQRTGVRAWRVPLEWTAIGFAVLGELYACGWIARGGSLHIASATSVLCAVVLLTVAYARRGRFWAYGGTAMLVVAGLTEIAASRISQPQTYALPVGIFIGALAWIEWRSGDRSQLKAPFELSALLVLLGTTVLQGAGYLGDGIERYPYDVVLIVEGMAVLGLGAVLHWWRSLCAGAAAVIVAVILLLLEPLASVNTWYLIGSLGLALMAAVVFLERRRQQIPVWIDGWRERLETWG